MAYVRQVLDISQQTWAGVLGVSVRVVQQWEAGDRVPSRQTRMHIREVLRRPNLRRSIHRNAEAESSLIAIGWIDPLEKLLPYYREFRVLLVEAGMVQPRKAA